MKRFKLFAAAIAVGAAVSAAAFAGCAPSGSDVEEAAVPRIDYTQEDPSIDEKNTSNDNNKDNNEDNNKAKTVSYITVTSDGVNIRSGAGTSYSVSGVAEKSTRYAVIGKSDGWYKTTYKNKTAYISEKYCTLVDMSASADERVEAVIAEGAKLLGTPYVYGATRYHDGKGNLNKNFNIGKFDCSSLMQYIFYKGAGVLLDVNTRTQIYQGKTVKKADLQRGDLMFFTNAERKNLSGIERVGHVALYLGDGYILHTASDYAKIEKISTTRWNYFIQGQRIL